MLVMAVAFRHAGNGDVAGRGRGTGVQRQDDRDGQGAADDLGADEGGHRCRGIPAKVSENIRPKVMAGSAKLVEDVKKYAAPM